MRTTSSLHLAAAEGDRLVEQRQAVAQRALRGARDQRDARRRRARSPSASRIVRRAAARSARGASGFRLNCRQRDSTVTGIFCGSVVASTNLHVLGRLLERLQHRVERGLRQHVHFVDQVDLVAADRRRVARVVEDLAHVVDAGVRRGVELEQVDEAAGVDVDARGAHAARRRA